MRIFGTPKAEGLPETRAGAEEAERRAITRVLNTADQEQPSSVDPKNAILTCHLLPLIGGLTLDRITYAVIEDLKLALAKKTITRFVCSIPIAVAEFWQSSVENRVTSRERCSEGGYRRRELVRVEPARIGISDEESTNDADLREPSSPSTVARLATALARAVLSRDELGALRLACEVRGLFPDEV